MERIRLTKGEKKVLRMIADNADLDRFVTADVDELREKGFVQPMYIEGHQLEGLRLTDKGRAYMEQYPRLRNPIDKESLSLIISAAALLVGIISLLVACTILRNQRAEKEYAARHELCYSSPFLNNATTLDSATIYNQHKNKQD